VPYKNLYKKREYQANWCRQNRLDAIELLGGKCVVCGTMSDLEVDHIDPATKISHRIWSWSKVRRLAELQKCQVLCATHHLQKTKDYANIPPSKILKVHKAGCGCGGCANARALERIRAFELTHGSYGHGTVERTLRRAKARNDYEVFA
jgi:hypothetical protein